MRHVVKGKFSGCKIQAATADMRGLLDTAAKDSPGYYKRLLIEDLTEQLEIYKG